MEISRIEIAYEKAATEPMLKVGMHGKATVNFMNSDGTILMQANEMTLRKTRDGKWYAQEPYRTYERDGETKKAYYYRLFTGLSNEDRDKAMQAIVDKMKQALSIVDKGATNESASSVTVPEQRDSDPFDFG